MKVLKISWKSVGKFLGSSEPNKNRWPEGFTKELNSWDAHTPIVRTGKPEITRAIIFESLWVEMSIGFTRVVKPFEKLTDEDGRVIFTEDHPVAYAIQGITDILACLLSDKIESGIANKKANVSLKKIRSLLKIITQDFQLPPKMSRYYPGVTNDLSLVKESLDKAANTLSATILKLESLSKRERDLVTWAAFGAHFLRRSFSTPDIRELINAVLADLCAAGYGEIETTKVSGRMKNILAQRLNEDFPFADGPIKRVKGRKKSHKEMRANEASAMLRRYPNK